MFRQIDSNGKLDIRTRLGLQLSLDRYRDPRRRRIARRRIGGSSHDDKRKFYLLGNGRVLLAFGRADSLNIRFHDSVPVAQAKMLL